MPWVGLCLGWEIVLPVGAGLAREQFAGKARSHTRPASSHNAELFAGKPAPTTLILSSPYPAQRADQLFQLVRRCEHLGRHANAGAAGQVEARHGENAEVLVQALLQRIHLLR